MTNLQPVQEHNVTDEVLNRVFALQSSGALDLPANYSAANALKSAYLILRETKTKDKKLALEACTKESISSSLLDMVVQGLNPAKNQCYFIPYGDQLQLIRGYLGTVALTKRLPGVEDVKGYAIYKQDNLQLGFDFTTGKKTVKVYEPSVEHKPSDLVGAMGLIIGSGSILHVEYMDMEQIKAAWAMRKGEGLTGAHKQFPDQMAIKTVINRACKLYANTADDEGNVIAQLNKSMEVVDAEFEIEVEEKANKEPLQLVDVETGEIIETPSPSSAQAPF